MQYGVVAILYWPIMGFLILLGSRLDKRYPAGSFSAIEPIATITAIGRG
jgi:hypothetical protein